MDLNPLRNYIKNGENPVDSVRDIPLLKSKNIVLKKNE